MRRLQRKEGNVYAWLAALDVYGGVQDGETPALLAAMQGHAICIDALARHGADVDKAQNVSA